MFHRIEQVARPGTGLGIAGAKVTVYVNGTDTNGDYTSATKAQLYDPDNPALPIANPVETDVNGKYEYFVAGGVYDEVAKYGSLTDVETFIQMFDQTASTDLLGSWQYAPNWADNGSIYIPAALAMTLDLTGAPSIGTGTLAFAKSTGAAPDVFTDTTLPVDLEAGSWLRVTLSGLSGGFYAAHLLRTA